MITLYTTPECAQCQVMKRFLEEEEVALGLKDSYCVVNIRELDEVPDGITTVPAWDVNGKTEVGMRPRTIVSKWLQDVV